MAKQTPDELIEEFRTVFKRRHGKECVPLRYENGWFVFSHSSAPVRYRRAKLEENLDWQREQIRQMESLV